MATDEKSSSVLNNLVCFLTYRFKQKRRRKNHGIFSVDEEERRENEEKKNVCLKEEEKGKCSLMSMSMSIFFDFFFLLSHMNSFMGRGFSFLDR